MKTICRTIAGILAAATALTTLVEVPLTASASNAGESTSFIYDGYTVQYDVVRTWGTSKEISVTIIDTGTAPIENWLLYFDPNGETYGFSGAYPAVASNGVTYFENGGFNSTIEPNSSATFTYVVDGADNPPSEFALCQDLQQLQDGYTVSMQVNGEWGNQFNGQILLENTSSKPIVGWELAVKCNFTILSSWAADVTDLGSGEYLLKSTYNSTIPANSAVNLGFIGACEETAEIDGSVLCAITADEQKLQFLTSGYSVEDIYQMNFDSEYPVEIVQESDGIVTSIDGSFSDITVLDADSALNSIYTVRTLLGISDPANTLELNRINEGDDDNDYTSYFFDQVYNGIPVCGRNVTVVAKDSGQTLSLDSNYFPLKNFDITPDISMETIIADNPGFDAELVIYTYGGSSPRPFLAYVLTNSQVRRVVSASTGALIDEIGLLQTEPLIDDVADTVEPSQRIDIFTVDGMLCQSSYIPFSEDITDAQTARAIITSRQTDLNVDFESNIAVNSLGTVITQDDHAVTTYHFDQYFKGVRVFAREIAVSVEKEQMKKYWLSTNTVVIPDSFNITTTMEKPDLSAELVIYTWDDEENDAAPQLAYIYDDLNLSATKICLENGTVLTKPLGKGLDEGCFVNTGTAENPDYTKARPMKLRFFPITQLTDKDTNEVTGYKLSVKKSDVGISKGKDRVIEMRHTVDNTENILRNRTRDNTVTKETINSNTTYFYYPEAISTYLNAIDVTKWYGIESNLNRPFFVKVSEPDLDIVPQDIIVGVNSDRYLDNAYFSWAYINDTARWNHMYTYGASLDVVAHEFTHGVFSDITDYLYNSDSMARGINEGYADLFGHFVTNDWINGEQTIGQNAVTEPRNMANELTLTEDFSAVTIEVDTHEIIPLVNKPAYLLNTKYNVSMEDLIKIYYHSLYQAKYSYTSSLNSVRANVLKAAKALSYSPAVIQKIADAYNEIWTQNESADTLEFHVHEAGTGDLVRNFDATLISEKTGETIKLKDIGKQIIAPGKYQLTVSAYGYQTYCYQFYKIYGSQQLNINMVRETNTLSPVSVRIRDWVDKQVYDGVVKFSKLNNDGSATDVGSYQTGSNQIGLVKDVSLTAGYYLISVQGAADFVTKSVLSVPGNGKAVSTTFYDVGINPTYSTSVFVFQYGENNEYNTYLGRNPENHFKLEEPVVSHSANSNGKPALTCNIWQSGPFTMECDVYCYNSACTPYQIRFEISEEQMEMLKEIARAGTQFYSLEINCFDTQKPASNRTIILTAQEIIDNAVLANGVYKLSFAELAFDTLTNSFNMNILR